MFTGAVPQDTLPAERVTFEDLGLGPRTTGKLREIGFLQPTPIQAGVIPAALAGRDVVGLAQTGSGKTAAFGLPMVEHLSRKRGVRGLILCPTREIALQSNAFLKVVGKPHRLRTACLIGGVRFGPQLKDLGSDPDVVVATPGRLLDHHGRKNIRFDSVECLVLDEGDHMLDLGFLPQISRILDALPRQRQSMLFSATLPQPIRRLAQRVLADPVLVDLRPRGRAAAGIDHRLYLVRHQDMRKCLMTLVDDEPGSMLIFLRRKVDAEWACRQLGLAGHPVERIHSDRSQRQRVAALKGLREGEHRVLVATDIAARGLDLPIVRHVVNFGLPDSVEDYIHRAGRTARGSLKGIVSSISTWQDKATIREIEKVLGRQLPRCRVEGVEPWVERAAPARGKRKVRRRLF